MMHLQISGIASGDGGSWEYADLATAESSGDPWMDGDDIQITGGALFLYKSALAVDNYSGLIHKEPYGSGLGTLSVTTVINSEDENVDPDSWTGYTDDSTGSKGSDYEFDTDAGLARFRKLTAAGEAKYTNDHDVASGDEETFLLLEQVSSTNTNTNTANAVNFNSLRAYVGASDYRYVRLDGANDATSTNWRINHTDTTTFAESTISRLAAARLWLYLKDGRWALWNSDDSTPELSGTVPRTLTSVPIHELKAGIANAGTWTAIQLMGRFVVGKMTTS